MRMRRALVPLICTLLVLAAAPARAAALPSIDAAAFGIELCPQSVCGAAIFAGVLSGRVGTTPAGGTFAVAVTHEALPDPFQQSKVTGGVFSLRLNGRDIHGAVTGGTLENLGNNTFQVTMTLAATDGRILTFEGILNHNVFPPTIVGHLTGL